MLHPLDNDTAPGGRLLSIRSVDRVAGARLQATISPDGQTVQLSLPPGATGRTSFVYFIDDGRDGKTAHATVTVPIRQPTENTDPRLRLGFEPRQWTVPAGGVLDVPVLPDWRDRADGDPIVGHRRRHRRRREERRRRAAHRERPDPGDRPGGRRAAGDPLHRLRRHRRRRRAELHRRRAGPQGPAGVPGRGRARRHQRAGGRADHALTARQRPARLRPAHARRAAGLAGQLPSPGGAETKTDLVEGTVTFTASVADTYFLDYDAAYGNAPLAQGTIRIDVRNPERPPDAPVAMPDTALISGQEAILVDVLRNDLDPAGGLLTVQAADARTATSSTWPSSTAGGCASPRAQGELADNPSLVRYEITNGCRSGIEGEIVVTQREPERDVPVTEKDAVTVRAGAAVAIPALDNDFSPSGGELSLVEHVAERGVGLAHGAAAGRREDPDRPGLRDRQLRPVRRAGRPRRRADATRSPTSPRTSKASPPRARSRSRSSRRRGRTSRPSRPRSRAGWSPATDHAASSPAAGSTPTVTPSPCSASPRRPSWAASCAPAPTPSTTSRSRAASGPTSSPTRSPTPSAAPRPAPPGSRSRRPAAPQPPLAVDDPITVEPGRTATVDILANDHVASGDPRHDRLLDPPAGVRARDRGGPA